MSISQTAGVFRTSNIPLKVCLAAVLFIYSLLVHSVTEQWSNNLPVFERLSNLESQQHDAVLTQSQYTKSNMFMLKDAFCNFTNGVLVCHRAAGFRYATK